MMVGCGLGGTGTVSGAGTVVVPCGRYCDGTGWVVTVSSGIQVSHQYPFWFWGRGVAPHVLSCLPFF